MSLAQDAFCTDSASLLDTLASAHDLLLIQDLDGVCMELVRDPLERRLSRDYVEAAATLGPRFYVLTNGEHVGRRGVNALVDRLFAEPGQANSLGTYLPGLAAGGVQWQDRDGEVTHPGVGADELAFLRAVPAQASGFLRARLAAPPFGLPADAIEDLVGSAVLDNAVSPTLNANRLHQRLGADAPRYVELQQALAGFMDTLLRQAAAQGLGASFFVHYAPNLGRDAEGRERWKPAAGADAGTTDFQFMLRGAVKEAGVLVLLNRHYQRRTGHCPLGEGFSVREAPRDLPALRALVRARFDPAHMPCIVGVGDTVGSVRQAEGDRAHWLRGGSDRGFLQLVQGLGEDFGSGNRVLYVDSSGGQVRRPGVDAAALARWRQTPGATPWGALEGITDADDPLRLDQVFTGGHREYVAFFVALAQRLSRRDAM